MRLGLSELAVDVPVRLVRIVVHEVEILYLRSCGDRYHLAWRRMTPADLLWIFLIEISAVRDQHITPGDKFGETRPIRLVAARMPRKVELVIRDVA